MKKVDTLQGSPEETMGLIGPGSPRYKKKLHERKSLHGVMDYICYITKLPLDIRCFPDSKLVVSRGKH